MKNIGLIFPGQGAQYVGMMKELYDTFAPARETMDQANDVLGIDLTSIIFNGPEETLRQTQFTQPAIFASSMAAYRVLAAQTDIASRAAFTAGHSLGEYAAFCAAGAFSYDTGLRLVKARGEFIQQASEKHPGTMAAVIGLDAGRVRELCVAASTGTEICEAVNFNSPGQIVIAGTTLAVTTAIGLATAAGATKAVLLNVSGPFHSSLMQEAAVRMRGELARYAIASPSVPIMTNCDARPTSSGSDIMEKLVMQIHSPVLWEDSIKAMIAAGVEIFIEVGPQRVLSGLLRRIDKTKKCVNIEDVKSLESVKSILHA